MSLDHRTWHMPLIDLSKKPQGPALIYIYSPSCGACIMRAPLFDEQVKTATGAIPGVWRFNAREGSKVKELADMGFKLQYYPTILGIRKSGKLYEANVSTKSEVITMLEALKRT